jgi:hypothetical protein
MYTLPFGELFLNTLSNRNNTGINGESQCVQLSTTLARLGLITEK